MGWEVEIKEGPYDPPRSVSELAKCPYRFAYEYLYLTKEDVEKITTTASLGSLIHRAFTLVLKRDGVEYQCLKEVEAPRRFGLAARVDYLCRHGDEYVVVEVKSARPEFLDEHIRQVRIYMLLLEANKGLVVYVTRTPKPQVLKVVEVDRPMTEDELLDLINKHQMVVPIPGSYCKLCPVKTCKHYPYRVYELL